MTSRVDRDNRVTLPEEVARGLGLHEGDPVEWRRTSDGSFTLQKAPQPSGAESPFRGFLKPHVKADGGGVEEFLRWREEDARLDGSL